MVLYLVLSMKVVQYKQQSRLEEKRKKALDLQLDFIVGQTEKYSDLLSKSLAPTRPAETVPVTPQKPPQPLADEDGKKLFVLLEQPAPSTVNGAYCLHVIVMETALRDESLVQIGTLS